ncbi:hypothetical protein WJX74_007114 [Apatococcus lobatus]|uniref:RING-type domain-containing protein n=1 Tax=Apatococcus lobatus TaxID=904363 RepID=A0AAW1QWN4_9CHLO
MPSESTEFRAASSQGPGEQTMEPARQLLEAGSPESEASSSEGSSSNNISLSTAHSRPSSHRQADQIQLSGSETEEASPAASAERHRIGASGAVDLRDIAVWLEKSFPYLALLFIIFLREHWLGILVSGCLTMNLKAANHILREQVMLKERRSNSRLWTMALVFGISFPAMIITVKTLSSQDLWPFFILLIPASIPTAWHAVVLAVAIDTLARCMGCAVKAAVLALHRATPDEAFRRRSSLLTLLEHTLLCYRVLLTSPIWFRYFLSMPGHFIPVGMAGFYLACKMHLFFKQIGIIFAAARVACRSEAVFGKNASSDEVMEVGNKCPICQENMQQPVKLSCNHIFCNGCILEWFERGCTCPMCRAEIKPKGLTFHSDGTTGLLPQIF